MVDSVGRNTEMTETASHPENSDAEFPRRKPGQSVGNSLMEVGRFMAPRLRDGPSYEEVMGELYDPETGLPRGCEIPREKPKA